MLSKAQAINITLPKYDSILALGLDNAGILWLATQQGLYSQTGNETKLQLNYQFTATPLVEYGLNQIDLLFKTPKNIITIQNGKATVTPNTNLLISSFNKKALPSQWSNIIQNINPADKLLAINNQEWLHLHYDTIKVYSGSALLNTFFQNGLRKLFPLVHNNFLYLVDNANNKVLKINYTTKLAVQENLNSSMQQLFNKNAITTIFESTDCQIASNNNAVYKFTPSQAQLLFSLEANQRYLFAYNPSLPQHIVYALNNKVFAMQTDSQGATPQLAINNIQFGSEGKPLTDSLLWPNQFKYATINLRWPLIANGTYQYTIQGFYDLPQNLKPGEAIKINYLTAGSYSLIVERLGQENEKKEVLNYKFTIAKPWYATWMGWLLVAAGMAIIWLLVLMVIRGYKKYLRQQAEYKLQLQTVELNKANKLLSRKINELEFNQRLLHNATEFKEKLYSIFSHDLLAPMRFMNMVTKTMVTSQKNMTDEQVRFGLEDLNDSSQKLLQLSVNLLSWLQNQKEDFKPLLEELLIEDVVRDKINFYGKIAQGKQVQVQSFFEPDKKIVSDKKLLGIVVENLLSNAIKFSFHNTSIIIRGYSEDYYYALTIQDFGMGMPAEQIRELKNADTITPSLDTERQRGSGLGWLVIKEIFNKLNIIFDIDSVVDEGTTIKLKFMTVNL
jgi:signal transduction histidine kinase